MLVWLPFWVQKFWVKVARLESGCVDCHLTVCLSNYNIQRESKKTDTALLTMSVTSATDVSMPAFEPEEDISNIHRDIICSNVVNYNKLS